MAGAALVAILVGTQMASLARAEDETAAAAKSARPATRVRLEAIYTDRTWRWPDGAAYFAAAPDRKFTAWVNTDAKSSYAEGSWSATDDGRLCFTAKWHALRGSKAAKTCFDHRADDKAIYQRRLPTGSWYVFGHMPAQSGDELEKLESGDQVSANYEKNKQYIAENSRRRRSR